LRNVEQTNQRDNDNEDFDHIKLRVFILIIKSLFLKS
jgi:hypothetical protein